MVYAESYAAGYVIPPDSSFAEGVQFGAGVDFGDTAYTFPAGTYFSGAHEFTGTSFHQYTSNGIIFGDGSGIVFSTGTAQTFGTNADFSAGVVKDGLNAGEIVQTNTYGAGSMFADDQTFAASQNFAKYNHFGENTDFTEATQTFKEGMAFGPGSIFRTNQVLPVGTIPSHGVVINAVTCSDASCVPDPADVIAPGEKYESGIDPAATLHPIRSDKKSFEVEGLGLKMEFDTVSTNGSIKADLVDPANVAGITLSGDTISMDGLGESVGNVIELSTEDATISGEIIVTLPYQDSEVGDNENNLTMYHYVENKWIEEQNCTTDTSANTVTCTVTSLSPFSVGHNSSSTGGHSSRECDSHAFGKNKSLNVEQISYDINSFELKVHAYSTCCLLYTSPSPRDRTRSRMPSSA